MRSSGDEYLDVFIFCDLRLEYSDLFFRVGGYFFY